MTWRALLDSDVYQALPLPPCRARTRRVGLRPPLFFAPPRAAAGTAAPWKLALEEANVLEVLRVAGAAAAGRACQTCLATS